MAPRITDAQKAAYAMHRYQQGMARAAAARMAGVSNAWAVGFDVDMQDDPLELERILDISPFLTGEIGAPKPRDEMLPVAQMLLDDFEQFRYKVMGRTCRPWAVEAAHRVAEMFESPEREFCVINVSPGSGKTTLMSLDIPAWLTCRSRTIRGVLGTIKQGLSTKNTRRLRTEFEREVPLRAGAEAREQRGAVDAQFTMSQLYGRFRPLKPLVWRAEGFIVEAEDEAERTEKEYTWFAASMEEDFIGDRVNFQSWDDAASMNSSRSPNIRAAHFEQWEIVEDRLEPGGLLLLVGQRLTTTDIYRHALDKLVTQEIDADGDDLAEPVVKPKYHHIVYRAHDESRCTQQHRRDAPAWPDGCLLDPSGLPWRDLEGKMGNRANYELVYQQDDTSNPEAKFRTIWINGGREASTGILFPGCWDDQRDPGEIPAHLGPGMLSYASVDPSASGYWVVQWWLHDQLDDRRYLIDQHRSKMGANDLLELLPGGNVYRGIMEDWQDRSAELGHRIRFWIIEHNSQQKWLSQYEWARRWYSNRRVKVISHQTYAHTKLDDKLGPEGSLPRLFENGLIRLPGSPAGRRMCQPFVIELLHWGSHSTNDCVMAAWMAEFNLDAMRKQPTEVDPPTMWVPSWMRREGEHTRAERALMAMSRMDGGARL